MKNTENINIEHRTNGKAKIKGSEEIKYFSRGGMIKGLISVVVPAYQEEKIIADNLKIYSRELRKKFNFELIVSDGGSTDKTADNASPFADKVVLHSRDDRQTIAEGRNKGAEVAEGEYFVFINADTLPEDAEKFFTIIRDWADGKNKLSKFDALATYVTYFEEEALLRDKLFYKFHNTYVRFLNAIGMGMGRGECQIVKRTTFEKVEGYNGTIVAGEDFDLYRRIGSVGKIGFANEIRVCESPRRFRKYGYFRIIMTWLLNSLSVMFRGRSMSSEWEAVR